MRTYLGQKAPTITGPLNDGVCVRQSFKALGSSLLSVSIQFATYKRVNPGELVIELIDFTGKVIKTVKLDSSVLADNSYRDFGFGVDLFPGKMYELRISGRGCRSGRSPTLFWGDKTAKDGHMFVGARLIRGGELCCVFQYVDAPGKPKIPAEPAKPKLVLTSRTGATVPGMISVIIPHFNCVEYLAECLASIAAQTYSCLEVIVVEDGSDRWREAEAIVNAWRPALNSIRFIQLERNGGAPAARNAGVANSSGEYLYFADADIRLYPRAFEKLLTCLIENQDVDFAYGGFLWGGERVEPRTFDVERLKKGNFVSTMSLVRSRVFPGWDETLKRHQDWDLWLTIVEKGGQGMCCGEYLFETPKRPDGISSGKVISMRESKDIILAKHGYLSQ
jgi:hypothetical protein